MAGVGASLPALARRIAAPPPEITAPLADTPAKGLLVWNLDAVGYVAEEYFLSGRADIYSPVSMADAPDVASRDNVEDLGRRDFTRQLLSAARPFTTRLIVYRPRSAQRFSGNVIVETLHPTAGGTSVAWTALHPYFTAHGDAHVAVQHPLTIAGVKTADGIRYKPLRTADATQLWGMLAQTGAMLKAGGPRSPLHGYAVKRLVMTGYSYTGVATTTFANFHHNDARLADGRPIFDAYVPMANAQYVRPLDVPVMRLNTESDFSGFGGLGNRRPDDERYRHYEVAGAAHVSQPPHDAAMPPPSERIPAPAGQPHFSMSDCQATFPPGSHTNDFPLYLFQATMFENMYRWLEAGRAPPPSAHIETLADGTTRVDRWGNALGGVRYPQLALPVARYGVGTTDRCVLFGYTAPFEADVCRSLYGDRAEYVAKTTALALRLVDERMVLRDGAAQLAAMAQTSGAF